MDRLLSKSFPLTNTRYTGCCMEQSGWRARTRLRPNSTCIGMAYPQKFGRYNHGMFSILPASRFFRRRDKRQWWREGSRSQSQSQNQRYDSITAFSNVCNAYNDPVFSQARKQSRRKPQTRRTQREVALIVLLPALRVFFTSPMCICYQSTRIDRYRPCLICVDRIRYVENMGIKIG